MQEVTLGRRAPGLVEIVSGASAGDLLIIEGTQKVRDGSDVEVIELRTAENASSIAGGSP
jgi:membrane fusion protein, multidrug efflux system